MMNITKDTKISDIIREYPWLIDEAIKMDARLKIIKSPFVKLFIKKATIEDASEKAGIPAEEIISRVTALINKHNA